MNKSIRLHPKYGLNPTMTTCYYCNEPSKIILVGSGVAKFKEAGLASSDGEMNHNIGMVNTHPCPKCEGYMKQGIIMISVRDDQIEELESANREHRTPDPYRTGGWCVISEEYIRKVVNPPELLESIMKRRMSFVPDQVWNSLGLPRE